MPYLDEFADSWSDRFGKFIASTYSVVDAGFDAAFPADFFPTTIIVNPPPVTIQARERQRYALFVRDGNHKLVGQIGDYASATLTPRWPSAGVGEWHLTLPREAPITDKLLAPRAGLVVTRDEKIFFSGQKIAQERQVENGESNVVFDGIDDTALVGWRVAMTQPGSPIPPYVINDNDMRTGLTSTLMWQYVNVNLGPGAVAQRRYAGLTMGADPFVGPSQTGHAKYQGLDQLVQQLATLVPSPGLGYRITQVDAVGTLVFDVIVPNDRTRKAVFDVALGNITALTYKESAGVNYDIGGGSGNSIDRVIIEQADTAAIVKWGRIEGFVDHSDLSTIEDMTAALTADLTGSAAVVAATFTIADTSNLRFGIDYDLGDLVTVIVDNEPFVDVVREATITLEKDAAKIDVVVATQNFVAPTKHVVAAVVALKHQVRDLQRNKGA